MHKRKANCNLLECFRAITLWNSVKKKKLYKGHKIKKGCTKQPRKLNYQLIFTSLS